ncbi:MAG: hypothetical protein JWN76_3779 [Chitinophagaceae bacterium]|nr:hypothetical protein [Chitinophagaceae bacterium]
MSNEQKTQPGTGSAENQNRSRDEQSNKLASLNPETRTKLSNELGGNPDDIADIKDTGNLSGRDDYSGNHDEGMTNQNTGETTDR